MSPGRIVLMVSLVRALLGSNCGAAKDLSVQPVPRSDTNSLVAHQQLLRKAKPGRIDIYFLGDSITRRWGATDPAYRPLLENWKTNFFGWNAANFGWGGDRIQNILWRVSNGELDGVNPKVIVLLAGTNDLGPGSDDSSKVGEIAAGIRELIRVCQEKAPNAVLILTAIFPRADHPALLPDIAAINQQLSKLADGKHIRFLNINPQLSGSDGKPLPGMMNPDGLHPTLKTYQVWADALKPIFSEFLGPPGSVDYAPPPTGDPKAN